MNYTHLYKITIGIPEIERLAITQEQRIQQLGLSSARGLPYSFIPDEQKIELATRVLVKPKFREALAGKVGAGLLQKLEDVFFKTSYPTPPVHLPF